MDVEEPEIHPIPEIHPVPVRGQVGRQACVQRNSDAGQSSRVQIIPSDRTDFNVTSTTLLGDNPVREVPWMGGCFSIVSCSDHLGLIYL